MLPPWEVVQGVDPHCIRFYSRCFRAETPSMRRRARSTVERWRGCSIMGFVLRCPKCESTNVAMFMDKQLRWSGNRDGERVLSCRACGKMLYGSAATAELDKQQAANDRVVPTPPPAPTGPSDADILAQIRRNLAATRQKALVEARAEIKGLLAKARAEGARVGPLRKSIPRASPLYCNINLIDIGVASIERIAGELDRALSPNKVVESLIEARAIMRRFPAAVEAILSSEPTTLSAPAGQTAPVKTKSEKLCVWTGCAKRRREGSEYCSNDCRIKKARYTYDIKRGRIKVPLNDPHHIPQGR